MTHFESDKPFEKSLRNKQGFGGARDGGDR